MLESYIIIMGYQNLLWAIRICAMVTSALLHIIHVWVVVVGVVDLVLNNKSRFVESSSSKC